MGAILTSLKYNVNKALVNPEAIEEAKKEERLLQLGKAEEELAAKKEEEAKIEEAQKVEEAKTQTDKVIEGITIAMQVLIPLAVSFVIGSFAANKAISRAPAIRVLYFFFGSGISVFIFNAMLLPATITKLITFIVILFIIAALFGAYFAINNSFPFFAFLPLYTQMDAETMPKSTLNKILDYFFAWDPKDIYKNNLYQKMRGEYLARLEKNAK